MAFTFNTVEEDGQTRVHEYRELPDTCPFCHQGIDPRFRFAYGGITEGELVFQCPRQGCRRLFIAYYDFIRSPHLLLRVGPWAPERQDFSEEIKAVSPDFVDIYNESLFAEREGLRQISGAGYRKALEFLIKDYALSRANDSDEKEKIRKSWLGRVIEDHVDNDNVKATARMAAWLGNDETHYVRKWTDMDINDLKTLIELTVRWIESEELTKKYLGRMSGAVAGTESQ